MRAFIYAGGELNPANITEKPKGDDLVIAADSGYHHAQTLGVRVQILLGDLDSIGAYTCPDNVEKITMPPEKDLTDTQLAIECAVERGAEEITIIGGLGGRLDHTLSCLAILENLHDRGIYATINSGNARVHYLNGGSLLLARSGYRYLSLLAIDDKVKNVTVQGCKYPLKKARLCRSLQYAVSNEITGNCAMISCTKGRLYVIESTDSL